MTFYTPLERLARSAKEQGMAVKADAETVLRLCEIARAAERTFDADGCMNIDGLLALFAALGTQPVKETP